MTGTIILSILMTLIAVLIFIMLLISMMSHIYTVIYPNKLTEDDMYKSVFMTLILSIIAIYLGS